MIHLASQPEGSVVSKSLLAKATEAPESFLSKILQTLSRAGLIQARRGVVGGFSLPARGEQASLLDVVECMDGPIALNVCVTSGASCHRHVQCPAHQVWLKAQTAMLSVLREAKIADMIPAPASHRFLLKVEQVGGGVHDDSTQLPTNSTAGLQFKQNKKN
jgi:Rrf2 family protein